MYADVFFLKNLWMDYMALAVTNHFLHRERKNRQILCAAMISSAGSLFLMLKIKDTILRMLVIHFIWNSVVILLCFGKEKKKKFLENWAVTYFMMLLLGGMVEFEQSVGWLDRFFFFQAALSGIGLGIFTKYLEKRRRLVSWLIPVGLIYKGCRHEMMGYLDTGNRLRDPLNGRPVCILGKKMAGNIFESGKEEIRLIPYKALGASNGLLPVLFVDALEFEYEKKRFEIRPAEVGIANDGLLEEKEYDLILHASFLGENGEGAENDSKICDAKV